MALRACTPDDAEAVCRLIDATIDVSYAEFYSPAINQFFKDFHNIARVRDRIAAGTAVVYVEDGEVIATGAAEDNRIFAMFVAPTHQGRGLGREIMAALEDRLRKAGHEEALLSMSLPSEPFYIGLGYVQ